MKIFGFWSFIILSGCVDRTFKESNLERRSPVAATVTNYAQVPSQTAKETRSTFITKTQPKVKINHPSLQNFKINTATSPSCKAADRIFLFNLIPAKKSHYDYAQAVCHIKPRFWLIVKFPLPNTPSTNYEGLREGKDFTIRQVLGLEKAVLEQIQDIPGKDLAGLQAQIAFINCLKFRKILSGSNLKSNKSDKKSVPALSLEGC